MKNFINVLLITLIYFISVKGQVQMINITFQVNTKNLSHGEAVYITGNHPNLGDWSPGVVKLEKVDEELWRIDLEFPKQFKVEYKFSKGSWATEAVMDDDEVPRNHSLVAEKDTNLFIEINKWKDQVKYKTAGQIYGDIVYHRQVKGKEIKPRDIIVWLPPGYNENRKYPVLYMHDGQNLFDPTTSSFGVDWQLDETAHRLITENEIEPLIIVGINNTPDRIDEYSPTAKGIAYMKFIVNVVKPFIDKNYATITGRENTLIGGSSMGGLISFMLAWYYPDVFSKAACFSPAFKYRDFNFAAVINEYKGEKKNVKFYIDNGGVDLDAKLQSGVDQMISSLKSLGYTEEEDLFIVIDKEAPHNEAAWAKRVWKPLKIFLGK